MLDKIRDGEEGKEDKEDFANIHKAKTADQSSNMPSVYDIMKRVAEIRPTPRRERVKSALWCTCITLSTLTFTFCGVTSLVGLSILGYELGLFSSIELGTT